METSGNPGGRFVRPEVEQLLGEWAWLIDHGRADEAAVLYTSDAEQTIGGVTARGIDTIAEGLRRRAALTGRTSRHVMSNLRLSDVTASTAQASWILTLYRSDDSARPPNAILIADVNDTFRLEDGRWKIRSREIVRIFADDA